MVQYSMVVLSDGRAKVMSGRDVSFASKQEVFDRVESAGDRDNVGSRLL